MDESIEGEPQHDPREIERLVLFPIDSITRISGLLNNVVANAVAAGEIPAERTDDEPYFVQLQGKLQEISMDTEVDLVPLQISPANISDIRDRVNKYQDQKGLSEEDRKKNNELIEEMDIRYRADIEAEKSKLAAKNSSRFGTGPRSSLSNWLTKKGKRGSIDGLG